MELSLNKESSAALRELAKSMPVAIDNIIIETEKLFQVYQTLSETLGEHKEDFYNLLLHIKNAQEDASEAVLSLPAMMEKTADGIDAYLASHPQLQ